MSKTIGAPSLDEVNSALLERLYALIQDVEEPEAILKLTECVAKLNTSWKGNDQFAKPENDEQRSERERSAVLGEILNG